MYPKALIDILADMVRAALIWQAEHEEQVGEPVNTCQNGLTRMPLGIHYPTHGGPPLMLIEGGQSNRNGSPEDEQP